MFPDIGTALLADLRFGLIVDLSRSQMCAGQAWLAKWLGHVKFAVTIILLFAASLTYGTFMESYHGTDYANRLVYKSFPFMGLQLCMFLSILTATLQRFPMKRHLYGFYVLHLGLLILFLGSFGPFFCSVLFRLTDRSSFGPFSSSAGKTHERSGQRTSGRERTDGRHTLRSVDGATEIRFDDSHVHKEWLQME